jgi:RNA polymerase sigma-70 factor (ECF subfamily)
MYYTVYLGMKSETPQQTDEEIAGLVARGDGELFGVLIERYESKLLRYGRKFLSDHEDIKDIVQDAFISAYQNIKSFDTSQKFSSWMYRIAHNALVNGLKKKSKNPLSYFDFDTFFPHPVYEDPSDGEREQREMRAMIDQYLDRIPQKYREVLILSYLEELSYKEVADVLQIPIGTVGVRLKRAKLALKELYEKNEHGTD